MEIKKLENGNYEITREILDDFIKEYGVDSND